MRIFISKAEEEVPKLKTFCLDKDIDLVARSLISFEAIDFDCPSAYDVIFFSSPRSVRYFLDRCPLPDGISLACVGQGTAKELIQRKLPVSFQGKEADTSKVARDFLQWCGERQVLFPVSNRSLRTVVDVFPENQRTILIAYQTKQEKRDIPSSDIYVFTSPSNVESFAESMRQSTKKALFIAWGPSTAKSLNSVGISTFRTLKESSEEALIDSLKDLTS